MEWSLDNPVKETPKPNMKYACYLIPISVATVSKDWPFLGNPRKNDRGGEQLLVSPA
jgi:hypothetical protein